MIVVMIIVYIILYFW